MGLLGVTTVDFGEEHLVSDVDGEQPRRGLLSNVSLDKEGRWLCPTFRVSLSIPLSLSLSLSLVPSTPAYLAYFRHTPH